jgi:thiamine biosynthesis lipoprotein
VTSTAIEHDTGRLRLAVEAMATRFELVLFGPEPRGLRSAGEEAIAEITRLDRQLSVFRPTSDVAWINARAADGPVRVEPHLFALLERCRTLSALTEGAFDITIAPLMRAWRFMGERGSIPEEVTRLAALAAVGWSRLQLHRDTSSVSFARPGMSLDLGAAGKGYAIDRAVAILREHGIARALVHGGTSSVHVLGASPDGFPWTIGWQSSGDELRRMVLHTGALSVSAVHGKSFVTGGREYGHVIDPRTGVPTCAARTAALTGPRSLECDALSTALLVLGPAWLPTLRQRFRGYEGHTAATH